MKQFYTLVALACISSTSFAQQPYIGPGGGEGLGQYGYLEKDAITFARLYRNTYGNIRKLNLSMTVNATTVAYPTTSSVNWQCDLDNSASQTTGNYNPADFGTSWVTGATVNASVTSLYCDGATGGPFNTRTMNIVDINNSAASLGTAVNGSCFKKVVGSFTIDVGSLTRTLTGIMVNLSGPSETNIGNSVYLYYEPATGTEVFNDTESSATLFGDWGGNSGTDGQYEAQGMTISFTGSYRFYLVVCINTAIANQTISTSIVNDGMWFSPANDSYTRLRIAATPIGTNIVLPVSFMKISGAMEGSVCRVSWDVADEVNVKDYILEKSLNGYDFAPVASVVAARFSTYSALDYNPAKGANFYRVKGLDVDGKATYSNVIKVVNGKIYGSLQLYPMPVSNKVNIKMVAMEKGTYTFSMVDMTGRLMAKSTFNYNGLDTAVPMNIPASAASGIYTITLSDGVQVWNQKLIVQ